MTELIWAVLPLALVTTKVPAIVCEPMKVPGAISETLICGDPLSVTPGGGAGSGVIVPLASASGSPNEV